VWCDKVSKHFRHKGRIPGPCLKLGFGDTHGVCSVRRGCGGGVRSGRRPRQSACPGQQGLGGESAPGPCSCGLLGGVGGGEGAARAGDVVEGSGGVEVVHLVHQTLPAGIGVEGDAHGTRAGQQVHHEAHAGHRHQRQAERLTVRERFVFVGVTKHSGVIYMYTKAHEIRNILLDIIAHDSNETTMKQSYSTKTIITNHA
jgi:hypothetical protein